MDTKFQNMLKNKDSPLHNCVTLSVTPSHLGSTNKVSVDFGGLESSYLQNSSSENLGSKRISHKNQTDRFISALSFFLQFYLLI